MKIRWTRQAISDLDDAYEFIAVDNPSAAGSLVVRIEETVGMLARNPTAGRFGRINGTRELVISGTPFLVPYRIHGRAIEILAVIHGARKWPGSL